MVGKGSLPFVLGSAVVLVTALGLMLAGSILEPPLPPVPAVVASATAGTEFEHNADGDLEGGDDTVVAPFAL